MTRVDVPATGESRLSMGEGVGWIKGPHNAVTAVQKLIIDGEGYRKCIAEWEELMEISYAELTVTRNQLDNANEKLRGSRQHRVEVKIDE
ncbi:MAG: hypothetical protein JKY81_04715 [Colwellia sp.]|nr:hypothetical protein [Colwellia sp.]